MTHLKTDQEFIDYNYTYTLSYKNDYELKYILKYCEGTVFYLRDMNSISTRLVLNYLIF